MKLICLVKLEKRSITPNTHPVSLNAYPSILAAPLCCYSYLIAVTSGEVTLHNHFETVLLSEY